VNEWIAMSVLAGLILLVGGYYLYSGIRTLRRTTPAFEMLPDERRFLRRQAWRRIINSFLMLLLSAELVAAYAAGLPKRIDGIIDEREHAAVDGVKPPLTDAQRQSVRFFGGCVIAFMFQLGVVIALAGLDFWATRRYALTKFRQIANERRAMIQRQLTKWREEREQD
jgi:hypothetical protein